jgi:hypothetical protein
MRILFDQGTPVQIRRSLSAHSVRTAREQGLSDPQNPALDCGHFSFVGCEAWIEEPL